MSDERRPLLMRVLEAMQEADNYYVSADQAQVAIALIRTDTLEEAAKVADAEPTPKDSIDSYDASAAYWSGRKEAAVEIAAAIRAMKDRA